MVLKRNSVERLKHDLFPTELTNQWDRLVETPYEKLPEEDIVRLQWFGMYHDKPKIGTFMMRVKIPSGILQPAGLDAIGEISELHGRDQGELTTRQNIQLHYITLDRCPEIFDRLKAAGLTTMGGCGDVVRNITGCPVAGVDHDELFDTYRPGRRDGELFLRQSRILGLAAQAQDFDRGVPLPMQCAGNQLHRAGRNDPRRP